MLKQTVVKDKSIQGKWVSFQVGSREFEVPVGSRKVLYKGIQEKQGLQFQDCESCMGI